jgi:hypothetical protein
MTRKIVSFDDIDGIHDDDFDEYFDNYNELTDDERREMETEMDKQFALLPWKEKMKVRVKMFFTFTFIDFFIMIARVFLVPLEHLYIKVKHVKTRCASCMKYNLHDPDTIEFCPKCGELWEQYEK